MQRDYSYDSRRCFDDLEPPEVTGIEAARRTVSRLGASQLATTGMPVLFAPDVAQGVVGHLVGAISGPSPVPQRLFFERTWLAKPCFQAG